MVNFAPLGNGKYLFTRESPSPKSYITGSGIGAPKLLTPDSVSISAKFLATLSGDIIASDYNYSEISTDGGNTWQPYSGTVGSLSAAPLPGGMLLRANYYNGAVLRSNDLGLHWRPGGYGIENSWAFDRTFKADGAAFAFTGLHLWKSTDNGENWEIAPIDTLFTSPYNFYYNLALAPNGDLYTIRDHRTLRSTDNANSFQDISLTNETLAKNATRISVNPHNGDVYLCGNALVARSSDYGQNWQILDTNMLFNYRPLVFHPSGDIYGIARNPTTSNNSLVRSSDGGYNWQYIQNNLPDDLADNVQIDPVGKIVANYSGFTFVSHNNGNTWINHNGPSYGSIMRLNAAGHIYLADISQNTIYKSEDDGAHWIALPALPSTYVDGIVDIAFDHEQRLVICTNGDGYFRTVQPTVAESMPANQPAVLKIFPNPAVNGSFRIDLGIISPDPLARLRIYDLYGRVIRNLPLNSTLTQLEIPEIPAGVYTVEIIQNDRIVGIGKLVVR